MKNLIWKGNVGDYECEITVAMNPVNEGIHIFKNAEMQREEITLNAKYAVSRGDYGNYIDIYSDEKAAALLLSNDMGYFLPNANIEVDGRQYPYFVFNRQRLRELDPIGTRFYDNMRYLKLGCFKVVYLLGQKALLTCEGRENMSIPSHLFVYDLGFSDSNLMYMQDVMNEKRYATVITTAEINIPDGYMLLKSEDITFEKGVSVQTIEQFEEMNQREQAVTMRRRKTR